MFSKIKSREDIQSAVAAFQANGGQVTRLPKSRRGIKGMEMREATSDFRRGQIVTDEILRQRADQRLAECERLRRVVGEEHFA